MQKVRSSSFGNCGNGLSQTSSSTTKTILGNLSNFSQQKGNISLRASTQAGAQQLSNRLAAVAVETDGNNMGRTYLKRIDNAGMKELSSYIKERIEKGTNVITDGCPAYKFLFAEYKHDPIKTIEQIKSGELPSKVHIVIANLKMWLRGTFNRYPEKHIQKNLDEFSFRFNRRWNLENIFDKLLYRCLLTNTVTFAELTG